jgi:hypothetical protein
MITDTITISTDFAPSYEEIQKARSDIVGNNEANISDEQFEQLRIYGEQLAGKEVREWHGWVQGVVPDDEVFENLKKDGINIDKFSVTVTLDMPTDPQTRLQGPATGNSALLSDVPYEQVKGIVAWQENATPLWQEIRFSGTIAEIRLGSNVSVSLVDSSIAP